MEKIRILAVTCLCLLIVSTTKAQISFGGTPPSFSLYKSQSIDKVKVKAFYPKQNMEVQKKQDAVAKRNGLPPIIATMIPAQIDLVKEGSWETMNSDSICRLTIASPHAQGIILYYEKFNIPSGGKLYIYNKEKTQILGAYTQQTNAGGGNFCTEIVYGDTLTLEYVHSKNHIMPSIIISNIGYCYNLAEMMLPNGSLLKATSSSCYVDVNCSPEGDNWQQQKKGVARLLVPIGQYTYLCSGSLVNNVYQDLTPYFLSAHHCFNQDGETANFASTLFYFNYESKSCGTSTLSSNAKTIVGAEMLVDIPLNGGSDGALLKLKTAIPDTYDVFYNGWDISTQPASSGVVIHHPNGELKKISTYTTEPTTMTVVDGSDVGATNAHWNVVYKETTNGFSVTAGGSSGSPMFNQDGRIVGTLTGGLSFCDTPTEADYYGKFYYHWNKATSQTQWMSKYLNPQDYAVTSINGISVKGDTIKGGDIIEIAPVIFGNYLYVNTSYVLKEMDVYSVSGRLMSRSSSSPINTRSWPSGVYIVTVSTSGGTGKAKVLKK